MSITNAEILNAIWGESNAEYQEKVTLATSATGGEVLEQLRQYPTAKNMFIDTFVNKVVMQTLNEELWKNPLSVFKKGAMPYGQTIEQIFVEDAETTVFGEHFKGSNSDEGDIFGKSTPDVKINYISVNIMNKYKVSVSNQQLQTAFTSEYGLGRLAMRLVQSVYQRAEKDDYGYTLYSLFNHIGNAAAGESVDMFIDIGGEPSDTNAKKILKIARALVGRLKYPSRKYNTLGVEAFSNPEKLVFLATPETIATLDVMALANVFNTDRANIKFRIMDADQLPKFTDKFIPHFGNRLVDPSTGKYKDIAEYVVNPKLVNAEIDAIIVDEDLIQLWDTINESRTFENPNTLITNYILHKQGVAGANPFKQFVCLFHTVE